MSRRPVPLVMTPEQFRAMTRMHASPVTADLVASQYERSRAEYRRTHWGTEPEAQSLSVARVANPFLGDLVEMGGLVAVTYETTKDGEAAHWTHKFRRGALPILAYNAGGLVIVGGGYRVTDRGIEG